MKPTIFGCFNLFHITASLQNAYVPKSVFSERQMDMPTRNANLFNGLTSLLSDSQIFDTDFSAIVGTFPYICKPAGGDCVITNSGKVARNIVR